MEILLHLHSAYKNCHFANCRSVEPGYKKRHILAVVRAIDAKFATKVHRTMQERNMVLTRKVFGQHLVPFRVDGHICSCTAHTPHMQSFTYVLHVHVTSNNSPSGMPFISRQKVWNPRSQ